MAKVPLVTKIKEKIKNKTSFLQINIFLTISKQQYLSQHYHRTTQHNLYTPEIVIKFEQAIDCIMKSSM